MDATGKGDNMEPWQYKQIEALNQIIRKEWTYIDIGGARGEMLSFFHQHMNNGYVFEPQPYNYKYLTETFSGEEGIAILDKAVSDKDGKIDLWLHPKSTHESNILGHDTAYNKYDSKIEVASIKLDSFIIDNNLDIDLIKIDVEGAEWHIFEGATKTLESKNIVYQVEFHLDEDWYKRSILYDYKYGIYDLSFNRLNETDSRIYQAILIKDSDDRFNNILKK